MSNAAQDPNAAGGVSSTDTPMGTSEHVERGKGKAIEQQPVQTDEDEDDDDEEEEDGEGEIA